MVFGEFFWFLPSHTLHTLLWRGSHPDNEGPVAEKNDSLIRALLVHLHMCVWILGTSNRHPQSWVCVIFNTPILHLPRFCHWFDFKARTVRAMSVCPFITLSLYLFEKELFRSTVLWILERFGIALLRMRVFFVQHYCKCLKSGISDFDARSIFQKSLSVSQSVTLP